MKNILWITNIPSPYRVDFFNELGRECNLTVVFEREYSSDRDINWTSTHFNDFKGIILQGFKIGSDKSISFGVIKHIDEKSYDDILVSNPFTPTGMIAISYLKFRNLAYSIVGDGAFVNKENFIKYYFKLNILKGAKYYFSTGKNHNDYYYKYRIKPEQIINYPFSSIRNNEIIAKPLDNIDKDIIKEKLNIKENKVVLAVGQFIHRKGFDVLIRASNNFASNVGVYFVGGEPTQEYLSLVEGDMKSNIHFIGHKDKEELKLYYKVCDVFVLPTREDIWGLVINEAMACGVPIITTNRCVAGLELIQNELNGYIVNVDDIFEMREKIEILLSDSEKSRLIGNNNLRVIKNYTIEKMVQVHLRTFCNNIESNKG